MPREYRGRAVDACTNAAVDTIRPSWSAEACLRSSLPWNPLVLGVSLDRVTRCEAACCERLGSRMAPSRRLFPIYPLAVILGKFAFAYCGLPFRIESSARGS